LGEVFIFVRSVLQVDRWKKKIGYVAKLSKERAAVEAKKVMEYCTSRSWDKEKGSN
jgi:hypothetical protein